MKKLWGFVFCLFVVFASVSAVFVIGTKTNAVTKVSADSNDYVPPPEGVTIWYSDDKAIGSFSNPVDLFNGGYIDNSSGFVRFNEYGGYSAYEAVTNKTTTYDKGNTTGTFTLDCGSSGCSLGSFTADDNSVFCSDSNDPNYTGYFIINPTCIWITSTQDNSQKEFTSLPYNVYNYPGTNKFMYKFPFAGIYTIRIRLIQDSQSYTCSFKFVVKRVAPVFQISYPGMQANLEDMNSVIIYKQTIEAPESVFTLQFSQTGGYPVDGESSTVMDGTYGIDGLPLDVFDVSLSSDGKKFTFKLKEGAEVENGRYDIKIKVQYDHFDNVSSTGLFYTLVNPTEVVSATITIQDAPKAPGFPWLDLIIGLGVLAILGGGLYAVRKLSAMSQVQHIRAKQRDEDLRNKAREENMRRLRAANSEEPPAT